MSGRNRVSNFSSPVGFGYIVVPTDIDRDVYVKTCYRKERVAIQLDYGGSVIKNCFVSRKAIQDLKFPATSDELGSCVAFIVPEFHNIPIIIDVVSKADESQLHEENSFMKRVTTKSGLVSVIGKGDTGELFINVESRDDDAGNIHITLKNGKNKSKFNLNCFGDVNVFANGRINLKALKEVNIQSVYFEGAVEKMSSQIQVNPDGFLVKDKAGNSIISNKEGQIKVHEGSHPAALADELKSQLEIMKSRIDSVISVLKNAQATSATSAVYAAAITAGMETIVNIEDFGNINSSKLFID